MSEYPKAKYHKSHGGTVVHNETEELALSNGWVNSPADLGVITAPSQAQIREQAMAKFKAAEKAETPTEDVEAEEEKVPVADEAQEDETSGPLGFGRRRRR